ncbi:MAG: beta-CASP ribonuclease aCPSF1 [Candidatus Aenigmarchaeota archaeon]|nr:beta-CASP ribonuclease aCPSF1 [Candidatus Aenigmarchaeota archaeon]
MEILEKVKASLPSESISRVEVEGSEIIVYTKDRDWFVKHEEEVKQVVSQLKKRIEVRPEASICLDQEATKKLIMEMVPPEANIHEIYFEVERSLVIIVAEKPGLVIGRGGETFRKVRAETFWVPRIERVPAIKSDVINGIRNVIHSEVKFRKEFLNKIGEKIFTERKTGRDWIRLIPLGGFREVGRSCLLIETPKSKILIDCGVSPGGLSSGSGGYPYLMTKEFDPAELDAIILSHAHLDHCGFVSYLYEYGYQGPMYCTTPTLDLFALLNLDFIDVIQRNASTPIFTAKGVKEAVRHSITLDYGEVSDVAPDVRLTFQNAGHILGSALVHLHIGEGLHNIVYALDQKYAKTNLLDSAFTDFQRVETLIMESTYGNPEDIIPPRLEMEKQLMDTIRRTIEKGGKVLIPSFSVERAQELMAILVEHKFDLPVFLDGMIWDANGIFTAYPEYLSRQMQNKIFNNEDPFKNEIFRRIASSQDREKAWNEGPSVIISTSGMLMGGPAMEHLKQLGEDPKNSLLFAGYQAEGTMGRRIQKGWREIPIRVDGGKTATMNLQMEITTIEGLSGHSDRKQLLNYINNLGSRPDKILFCHGEASKVVELARTVHKLFRVETATPRNLEGIRLK